MSEMRYAYNYAVIYRPLHMCDEVRTCTDTYDEESNATYLYIRIPEYDTVYMMKYYDEATNKWYYDKEMTNEWIPPEGTGTPIIPPV